MRIVAVIGCGLLALAGAAMAASRPPAASGPPWYSVEVLVFRHTGPAAAQGETWPASVPAPSLKNAIHPAAGTPGAYSVLARPSATMAQAQARLAGAAGYETVAEFGWRQPGSEAGAARPVSLAPLAATAAGAATPAVFSQTAPQSSAAGFGATPAPVRVDGTAMLIVADNKPHVVLNLRLCEPAPPGIRIQAPAATTAPLPVSAGSAGTADMAGTAVAAAQGQCFSLRQRRQVMPARLEYFDNPAFGALVLVRSVTPPAGAARALPEANGPGRSPFPD